MVNSPRANQDEGGPSFLNFLPLMEYSDSCGIGIDERFKRCHAGGELIYVYR